MQDVNQALAESFGMPAPAGALVSSIARGSAAAAVGLHAGDVITRIDGEPVRTGADVATRVGMASPGQPMRLTVWRDKTSREIEVALGKAEDSPVAAAAAAPVPGGLGLAVRPLSAEERRQAQLDHGLVVQDVAGAAARAGVRPGDVVLSLNGRPIDSVDQVRAVLATKPKHVALLIQRDDQQVFVPIELG